MKNVYEHFENCLRDEKNRRNEMISGSDEKRCVFSYWIFYKFYEELVILRMW